MKKFENVLGITTKVLLAIALLLIITISIKVLVFPKEVVKEENVKELNSKSESKENKEKGDIETDKENVDKVSASSKEVDELKEESNSEIEAEKDIKEEKSEPVKNYTNTQLDKSNFLLRLDEQIFNNDITEAVFMYMGGEVVYEDGPNKTSYPISYDSDIIVESKDGSNVSKVTLKYNMDSFVPMNISAESKVNLLDATISYVSSALQIENMNNYLYAPYNDGFIHQSGIDYSVSTEGSLKIVEFILVP